MMFSQCNTCSMVMYLTIQNQGECGHIEGHAYTPFYLSIMKLTCVFWALGFHVYNMIYIYVYESIIIASFSQENIISKYIKPLNNMHADTLGACTGPCLF